MLKWTARTTLCDSRTKAVIETTSDWRKIVFRLTISGPGAQQFSPDDIVVTFDTLEDAMAYTEEFDFKLYASRPCPRPKRDLPVAK